MDRLSRSPRPPAFRDRIDAGMQLAERLRPRVSTLPLDDVVVIGLARGGVVVAAEVAYLLGARLEAMVVRKLGAPGQPELAIGAITAGTGRVLNRALIADLRLSEPQVERITEQAREEARALSRELGIRPEGQDVAGRTAVLVDDGLATGATMRVAIDAAYAMGAARVIVAVPVAPLSMIEPFRTVADEVVAVIATNQLNAVGRWYEVFENVPSSTVRSILDTARRTREV